MSIKELIKMTNKYDGKGSFEKVAQPKKRVGAMWFMWGVCLTAALSCFGSVGYTGYRQHVKAAAQLQADKAAKIEEAQAANIAKMMTVFPVYRETKQFKESAKMAMTKISVDSLPATITAGLDETVDPNPACKIGADPGLWSVSLNTYENVVGSSDAGLQNGWGVSDGGVISIPADAVVGTYMISIDSGEECDGGMGNNSYTYVFKITPPCPTGGVLTHTP